MTFVRVLISTMLPDLLNDEQENIVTKKKGKSSSVLPQNSDIIYLYPPRSVSTNLLDVYFEHLHYLFPYLDEKAIRSANDSIYNENGVKRIKSVTLTLLNMVFALAYQWSQWSRKEKSIPSQQSLESNTFFQRAKILMSLEVLGTKTIESSKRRISINNVTNPEIVQVLLLMCEFLKGTSKSSICWNLLGSALKIGQQLGLHQAPEGPISDVREQEYRNRTWYTCVTLDR